MFHYSTLVCVHSFGRKDGGPFCHTYTLAGGRAHSRALSHKNKYTLNFFLYFPWRIVSQKSTFKGKSIMF